MGTRKAAVSPGLGKIARKRRRTGTNRFKPNAHKTRLPPKRFGGLEPILSCESCEVTEARQGAVMIILALLGFALTILIAILAFLVLAGLGPLDYY